MAPSTTPTMRAVVTSGTGGPEVLSIGDAPRPEPGPGEVLLRVAATTVNRADTHQRAGAYPPPPGDSDILGLEATGVVEALGPGVEGVAAGDRVMGLVKGGGYAEHARAHAGCMMRVPDDMPLGVAAAIPEVFLTAWLNLFREAALKPGETALVHGGASGVGTAAIQLLRRLADAHVLVTVGSEDKAVACLDLGADAAILYKREDFAERVMALTDGRGADVILDHIGGAYLQKNLACLATYGRLVIIGLLGGAKAELPIGPLMRKRQRIIGSVLRARPDAEKVAITRAFVEAAGEMLADGRLEPVIHTTLPLERVREAHELIEANANVGKVVLMVDDTLA
jgi:putative PIG3 family NAD(P)H quinone oxidoreductase